MILKNAEDGKYSKNYKITQIKIVWTPAKETRTFVDKENIGKGQQKNLKKLKDKVLENLK